METFLEWLTVAGVTILMFLIMAVAVYVLVCCGNEYPDLGDVDETDTA